MMRVVASIVVLLVLNGAAWRSRKAPPEKMRPVQPTPKTVPSPKTPNVHGATHESPPIVYSQWTKFCGKDSNDPQTKPSA